MSTRKGPPGDSVHQKVLSRVTDAVLSVDSDFRCTYLNHHAQELLGKDESELLGDVVWEAFPETTASTAREKMRTAFEEQRETRYQRYDESEERWFEVRLFPDTDGLSMFFEEITEQKDRETELERYEWIIESLPVAIGQNEPGAEGGLEYVNERMVEMFDLGSKEEARQYSVSDLYAASDDSVEIREQLRGGGRITGHEVELTTAEGRRFWGSVTATVDTIDGEEYFLGIVQDISERKEHERKLDDLHDATREMVSATSADEVAQIVTDTAEQSIGLRTNGVHLYDESTDGLVPVSVSDMSRELIGEPPVLDEGIAWRAFQSGEMEVCNDIEKADEIYNQDTSFQSELTIPLDDHGVFIASDTETGAFDERDVVLNQILANNAGTALTQLQTEQRLRERERELERSRDVLDQTAKVAQVGGWEVDVAAGSLAWTDEVYRIHGKPLDYQPDFEDAISFYHPEDRDTISDAFERLTMEGEPYDLELRIVRPDDEVRWVRARGEPWYQDSEVVGARGTFQDVTERKEREQSLEQQNERLNEFAGVVSHDLRNPLAVATARTTILGQMCDGEKAEQVDTIAKSLDRMESIIEDTLTLARKGETVGETSPVPIIELVGACWGGVATDEASLQIDDQFTVLGDDNRLKHVFENLFRNAVEHGGEYVTVTVGRAGQASFYVEDDGVGIPAGDRETVFEAGHSSDPDGTGFGLTIVRRIAEAHGWEVAVTEGRDGGARFEFDSVEFA